MLLKEVAECIAAQTSFGLESTLSGRTYVDVFSKAKAAGYEIELHYLWLRTPETAVRRVKQRVRKGGHSVPEEDIRRRYARSIDHLLQHYLPLANRWFIYDNRNWPPVMLANSSSDDILAAESLFPAP